MPDDQELIDLTNQYNRVADTYQTEAANDLKNEIHSHIESRIYETQEST
ncbi:unnamed protein product, partial [Rotaria sp. Silwood2]